MIRFSAWGHPNITALHDRTLEFTKETDVTPAGDCIIGVKADYDLMKLRKFVQTHPEGMMTISAGGEQVSIHFISNPGFLDSHELVIRKSGFSSRRTLGQHADLSAKDIPDTMRARMSKDETRMTITLGPWETDN